MLALADETLEWRDVRGFVGLYAVSELGHVWSLPRVGDRFRTRGRLLRQATMTGGYAMVGLNRNAKRHAMSVSRLVCEAFHGPAPEGKPWVLHGDGDHTNNTPGNLRWGSPKENVEDSKKHGTFNPRKPSDTCEAGHRRIPENTRSYSYGRYCLDCVALSRAGQKEAQLKRGLAEDDPRHGTLGGYGNYDCRCGPCKETKRVHQVKYRERRRANVG